MIRNFSGSALKTLKQTKDLSAWTYFRFCRKNSLSHINSISDKVVLSGLEGGKMAASRLQMEGDDECGRNVGRLLMLWL